MSLLLTSDILHDNVLIPKGTKYNAKEHKEFESYFAEGGKAVNPNDSGLTNATEITIDPDATDPEGNEPKDETVKLTKREMLTAINDVLTANGEAMTEKDFKKTLKLWVPEVEAMYTDIVGNAK